MGVKMEKKMEKFADEQDGWESRNVYVSTDLVKKHYPGKSF